MVEGILPRTTGVADYGLLPAASGVLVSVIGLSGLIYNRFAGA